MTIRWGHVAIARRSENASDAFFVDLLELTKTRVRDLEATLAQRIFGRSVACRMIDYEGDGLRFEVFVPEDGEIGSRGWGHVCLAVSDRERLAARGSKANVRIVRVPRTGSDILFLEDPDGNLYEIQEARRSAGDRTS